MAATNRAVFYGTDTSCVSDLPRISVQVTDPVVLICQRLARRLQTPRGALALINGDPNFGFDCRTLVLQRQTPTSLTTAQATIQAECLKDEEVLSCRVEVAPAPTANGLQVTISGQASDGPFSFVLNVDAVTVALLMPFQGQV